MFRICRSEILFLELSGWDHLDRGLDDVVHIRAHAASAARSPRRGLLRPVRWPPAPRPDPVIRVYMMVVLLGARISSHLESAPSSFLSPWASGTSAGSPATVWCASSATFITAVVDTHPLVCRALDARVRELRRPGDGLEVVPEHGFGGGHAYGVCVHDQVVREVEVRRRRSLPDLRASGSIELEHLFGRKSPGRGGDGRYKKRCSSFPSGTRKLFGNPTPQIVPRPGRRRNDLKRRTVAAGCSMYPSGHAARGAGPGDRPWCARRFQWGSPSMLTMMDQASKWEHPPQSRY